MDISAKKRTEARAPMMMKQAPRREEKNAPGGLGDKIRQCSCTEFYLYLHKHCILLVMTCLYTYMKVHKEKVWKLCKFEKLWYYIIHDYKLQISSSTSSTGIQFGSYVGSTWNLMSCEVEA